jgi:DNA-binding LacI/PurR family transcriptional regulator
LKDIAHASGVDVSTVSRSLSGAYGINKETREKVLAAAASLNYKPNRVARGAGTRRSHTLALIVSDIRNPFFAEVARGAEDAAYVANSDLILCNSDLDAAKQMHYIESLLAKRVDGMLMNSVAGLDRTQQESLAASGIPIVLLNRTRSSSNFSTVTADDAEGGFLAGQRLVELGHRRIAHLTGPRDHGNMRERARGFLRAMAAFPDAVPLVIHGTQNYAGGRSMLHEAIHRDPGITAVFAGNDVVAFGALRGILDIGWKVPEEISVIGFDNVEIAEITHPPLTSIHQPKYEMGKAAVEMLVAAADLNRVHLPEHRVLSVRLVERQSCAPPRYTSL